MPLTGPAALLGAQCRAGAQMAVDEINAAGGVNGRRIEVSVEDSGGDNTSAINTFNKIIGDRPVAVVGSMITPQVLAISNLVQRESIPYLFSATSTTVTRQGIPWFFRLGVHDELRNRAAIRYLVDRLGKQRIAALHTNDDYGKTAAAVASDELKARYSKDLVADESFGGTDKDLSAQILSIQRANADGAMVNTFPTTMALALKQIKQLGANFTVMGDNSVISPVMGTLLTETEMDGAYAASGGVPQASDDPKVKAWIATYQERNNNTEPDGYSLANYDGVHLLAQALARAPSTEPQAVHDALMAIQNYPGLMFPYSFDQYGDGVHLVVISRNKGKNPEVLDTVWEEGYSA
jgi:branched-chain amino acid transport system substrate-binding protein